MPFPEVKNSLFQVAPLEVIFDSVMFEHLMIPGQSNCRPLFPIKSFRNSKVSESPEITSELLSPEKSSEAMVILSNKNNESRPEAASKYTVSFSVGMQFKEGPPDVADKCAGS